MRPSSIVCVLGCALAACGGGQVSASGSVSASVQIVDELRDPAALTGCATGDVAANVAIVADLRDSYHEMIVCGGLALDFTSALVNVLANAALGRGGPSAMTYQGNGTFASANGMMSIRAMVGGQTLSWNPLDPQSYLAGFSVRASAGGVLDVAARRGSPLKLLGAAAGSLDVQFQSPGPGFALLGLAADEIRGGRLLTNPKRIANAIASQISLATRIDVQDRKGDTVIHYILEGDPVSVKAVLDNKAVPMKLASIVATHAPTGQTIRVTEWTMQFKGDRSRVLDGTIGLDVEGGAFPYAVKFSYPHRAEPDIDLTCR